jgi:hypothetical protein
MRALKIFASVVVALALSAVVATTATAAEILWRWLPGSVKESFKGESGEATLQIKGFTPLRCTKAEVLLTGKEEGKEVSSVLIEEGSTEKKSTTSGKALIKFSGCKSIGIAFKSSNTTEAETVLVVADLHNCVIKSGDFGILFLPLGLVLEIPAAKQTLAISGSFVGLIEKNKEKANDYLLNIAQKEGVQAIEKCEGGVAESLKSSLNGEAAVQSGEEVKGGLIAFDKAIDTEEEIML